MVLTMKLQTVKAGMVTSMRGKKKKELPAYIRERISLDELLASRRVLQLVHERGPLTQGEASEALGLSQGACNLHFQRLEYEGLLRRAPGGSRNTTPYDVTRDGFDYYEELRRSAGEPERFTLLDELALEVLPRVKQA